jgi:mannosylglycoprotein endo-beta-mannosidase
MRSLNLALLSAWIFRYHLNSNVIWKNIIDYKYKTEYPNMLCCPMVGVSPFWKGVLSAVQAARMGVKWVVGNGRKIRFWKDIWLGNISLATVLWPLYVINEQQGKTVCEVWDGENLMLTFRRCVSPSTINLWLELCSLLEPISLSEEEDQILWHYTSSGKYSVQSLYAMINHRGVTPMYVGAIWKLAIPPWVQFFLWLLANNRTLTCDNLAKRKEVNDPSCLFCNEQESSPVFWVYCCSLCLGYRQ